MESLPAVYMIFTLLNAFRRGLPRDRIWIEFRRQKIRLHPRLSFWLALCRSAHLITETDPWHIGHLRPLVTRFAPQWLQMSPEAQAFHLIEAWENAPKNPRERLFRKKLLWKLTWEKPLTDKDRRVLPGLEALGLWDGDHLSAWGRLLLKDEGSTPTPLEPTPWHIEQDHLIAPVHQQTHLLWELENYLHPHTPGCYPLTQRALRHAAQQGDGKELIALLERGMKQPIPPDLRARILNQPSLQLFQGGIVLEFSHPSELKTLRRDPRLRQHFELYLSPRHVYVPSKEASSLLKMLERRGVYAAPERVEPESKQRPARPYFRQKNPLQPLGEPVPILALLEKYMQLQQAVDVLYRVPGYEAELRRITPLLIEPRGEHVYVTAYCQNRRAQRTFRLDRIEVPGTY